mgnify:FL=1
MIYYLSLQEVLQLHSKTVEISGGGSSAILNLGQIESILEHIKNDDYYPTIIDKLTHLFFGFCKFHCFSDGNKRAAIVISEAFLLYNGYLFASKVFIRESENISIHVADDCINKDFLSRILSAILDGSFDSDETLKLEYLKSINRIWLLFVLNFKLYCFLI